MPRAQSTILVGAATPTNGHTDGHYLTADLVDQPQLLAALRAVRAGDFGVRLPLDWTGVPGSISDV